MPGATISPQEVTVRKVGERYGCRVAAYVREAKKMKSGIAKMIPRIIFVLRDSLDNERIFTMCN